MNRARRRLAVSQPSRSAIPGRCQTGSTNLGDEHVAVFHQDLAIGFQTAKLDRFAQFQHLKTRLGDGDGQRDIDASFELIAEAFDDHMSERIERYDLSGIRPLWVGADLGHRHGIVKIGFEFRVQMSGRYGSSQINRIAARMGADRVSHHRVGDSTDNRAALGRVGTPI